MKMPRHRNTRLPVLRTAAAIVALGVVLGGCGLGQVYQRGYVMPEGALQQIPLGATQEQVLIVMGTPSTVATVSGDAFYYISQRTESAAAFIPDKPTDQRVIAIYFDKNRRVERLADYGIRDGKVFDYYQPHHADRRPRRQLPAIDLRKLPGRRLGAPEPTRR